MRLTVARVWEATQALHAIIAEKRPMPQIGKFRLARLHEKLLPEFRIVNAQRDELVKKHGNALDEIGGYGVPLANIPAFEADWAPIAAAEIEVAVEPVQLADLTFSVDGQPANGSIEVVELLALGELVVE